MKALRALNAREREYMVKLVKAEADKQLHDISVRAQYVWSIAMLQAGLSPRTVNRVAKQFSALMEKYKEYAAEQLADEWARITLQDAGCDAPDAVKLARIRSALCDSWAGAAEYARSFDVEVEP